MTKQLISIGADRTRLPRHRKGAKQDLTTSTAQETDLPPDVLRERVKRDQELLMLKRAAVAVPPTPLRARPFERALRPIAEAYAPPAPKPPAVYRWDAATKSAIRVR